MMTQNRASRGFTLIESAVVMVVSALLLVAMLQFYVSMQQRSVIQTTRQRLETIREKLDEYAQEQERLPCPERTPTEGNASADACSIHLSPPLSDKVVSGAVPAKALGLAGSDTFDGWGNRISYAVSRALTLPKGMNGTPPPKGSIGIVDTHDRNVLDAPNSGRYVIISHGPSGSGAVTREGVLIACDEQTLSGKNCGNHGVGPFVMAPWQMASGQNYFDNIVVHDDEIAPVQLLEHMAACNRKNLFYAPGARDADLDGCWMQPGKVFGACKVQGGAGAPLTSSLQWPPALTQGTRCGCAPGYTLVSAGRLAGFVAESLPTKATACDASSAPGTCDCKILGWGKDETETPPVQAANNQDLKNPCANNNPGVCGGWTWSCTAPPPESVLGASELYICARTAAH